MGFDFTHHMILSCWHANVLHHVPLRTGERRIFRVLFFACLAMGQAAAAGRPPLVLHDDIACLVYAYLQRLLADPESRSRLLELAGLIDLSLTDGLPARGADGYAGGAPEGFTLTVTVAAPAASAPPLVASIRYAVPIHHAHAHKCQWALGAGATPGAASCGEAAEWLNNWVGIAERAGALRNAGPGAYATGWSLTYTQYNSVRNDRAPEWMLSQLGKVIVRLRAAEEAFKVGLEAEFERRRSTPSAGVPTEGAVMLALNNTACDLAASGRDGLEGGPARRGAAGSATTKWVQRVQERDSLAAILHAVSPASIRARHVTRNIEVRAAAEAAEVATALTLALLHFPLGATALKRRQARRARDPAASSLTDYDFAQSVLEELTTRVEATRPDIFSAQAVFDSFKCAYVESCALALRINVEADRASSSGRVRVGERAAKAAESKLIILRKSLQEQLEILRLFQRHVDAAAVREWSVPTVASALLPGAFPPKLGRIQLTDAEALAPLLHLRNRRDRLREHLIMLRCSVGDAVINCVATIAALENVVRALTLATPDLTVLTSCGLTSVAGPSEVLFSQPLAGITPGERDALAAAGARGAWDGMRRMTAIRTKFARLARALDLVPEKAELRVVGSGQGVVRGRTIWERRGPRMLRGDLGVATWAAAAVVGLQPAESSEDEEEGASAESDSGESAESVASSVGGDLESLYSSDGDCESE